MVAAGVGLRAARDPDAAEGRPAAAAGEPEDGLEQIALGGLEHREAVLLGVDPRWGRVAILEVQLGVARDRGEGRAGAERPVPRAVGRERPEHGRAGLGGGGRRAQHGEHQGGGERATAPAQHRYRRREERTSTTRTMRGRAVLT